MYLTRLLLYKRDKHVIRDLDDCYQLHRSVMTMFPCDIGEHARETLGVLFRLEHRDGPFEQLLVQSKTEPDTSRLPSGYLYAGVEPAVSITDMTGALKHVKSGMTLHFKIKANPTRRTNPDITYEERKSGKKEMNGQRYPIRDDEELLAWLAKNGVKHGFEPLSVALVETGEKKGLISEKKIVSISKESPLPVGSKRRSVKFNSITFEGFLKVVDIEKFLECIKNGIGNEKSFGYGMLSIALVK